MSRDVKRALLTVVPFALYALYSAGRGELRIDHVLLVALALALATIGPRARDLLAGLYPFALVGLLYDGMRPFQKAGLTPERVLGCDLRAWEGALFGWRTEGGELRTVHDWFLVHHAPVIDLLAAVPYATFILVAIAACIFLYVKDRAAMRRLAWGFFALNVVGFATYHVLPAAPPWYLHSHGCTIDLAARASEGPALARVDGILGIHYFQGMYARASSVFGALPSLHCAYPALVAIEGFRVFGTRLRVASVAYWMWMVFASMYLDHHWLLDGLLGSAYAVVVAFGMRAGARVLARRRAPTPFTLDAAEPALARVRADGGE